MPFEPLSYRCTLLIKNFPKRWLPLIHLYDPDLPLFPTYYFHVFHENRQRVYGFIDRIRPLNSELEVSVICNKDLDEQEGSLLRRSVEREVRERLGISDPVTFNDISAAFSPPLDGFNSFLAQLWKRVVSQSFGDSLPFGRFYDEVFGLVRMVSTFFPPAGRKSELIQTHYFLSKFGEEIKVAVDAPKAIFYLLPTYVELRASPASFPKFRALCDAVDEFCLNFCDTTNVGRLIFSRFKRRAGELNTQNLLAWIGSLESRFHEPLIQCFNAFDKGPPRTVLFILMLKDLKDGRLFPREWTSADFGSIYTGLKGSYQSPKVLNLYAQQCFGNPSAFPIDTWINTFMEWPLWILPTKRGNLQKFFQCSRNLGKVERLLWLAAQSRKVHSPLCNDALWCTKFDSSGRPRGANPLSCCACLPEIRNSCPGFAKIAGKNVFFNIAAEQDFRITTTGHNNTQPNQRFVLCEGKIEGRVIHDDFTPVDVPDIFHAFPQAPHRGETLTVRKFIDIYREG